MYASSPGHRLSLTESQDDNRRSGGHAVALRDLRVSIVMSALLQHDTSGDVAGAFSFLDVYSGGGSVSLAVSKKYKKATVVSVETSGTASSASFARSKRCSQQRP